MKLRDLQNLIPFTGIRNIDLEVVCIDPFRIHKEPYKDTSDEVKTSFVNNLKRFGLEPGKIYKVTKVEGHGDPIDLYLSDINQWFCERFFVDTDALEKLVGSD